MQEDLREVIGCWPVHEVRQQDGEGTALFRHRTNGRFEVLKYVETDEEEVVAIGKTYLAGIDTPLPVVSSEYLHIWARYDPVNRTIVGEKIGNQMEVGGSPFEEIRLFSDRELRGCGALPKVNQNKKK